MAKIINTSQFRGSVEENQGVVVVDFFATWCGPCKMLAPILEDIASSRDDMKIVKIDVDQNPNLSKEFAIMSVPTLILFKNGEIIATEHGFMPASALENWINENR